MGLADIEKKIIEEAKAEERRIKGRAVEEVSRIEEQARTQAAEIREGILRRAQQKAEEEKTSLLVPARLAARARLLEEKHKIMDEVCAGVPPEVREKKEIEVAKFLYG